MLGAASAQWPAVAGSRLGCTDWQWAPTAPEERGGHKTGSPQAIELRLSSYGYNPSPASGTRLASLLREPICYGYA
jgi:hypothetical protein